MKLRLLSILFISFFFSREMKAQCSAGFIRNAATGSVNQLALCTNDGQADEVVFAADYQINSNVAVLVTNTSGQLIALSQGQSFDFEGFASGTCRAFLLSYTGTLTVSLGDNIYSVPLSTGCYRRSFNFIQINHRTPTAGSITDNRGESIASLCVGDNVPDFVGYQVLGAAADQYVYLITDVFGNLEKVDYNDFENFGFLSAGISRVYGLAFSGQLRIRQGQNIFTDQLVDGCFELTDNFLTIERNDVDGGQILVGGEEHITVDSTTSQAPLVDLRNNSSSSFVYVIIDQSSIIRGFSQGPSVDMSFLSEGKYWIYGFSYTGIVQVEVGQRLWGNRFASNCFEHSNAVVVTKETPASSTPPCAAFAGEISALASPVMLQSGVASVDGALDGTAVVPSSYDSVFFLTVGPAETIIALSISGPNFSVTTADTFAVYYLNAEVTDSGSPDYFDLGTIQFGVTTIGDIATGILDEAVCADLTIPGAEVIVLPDPDFCGAFASEAIAVQGTVPLVNGDAIIEATPDGGATIPANYEMTFVLTKGIDQTVIALRDDPLFTVTEAGFYTIHPLVAETSDPMDLNYLDRSDWVRNGIDIFGVFDIITAEGICADIAFFSAEFQVTSGSSCAAFSGSVNPAADTVILNNQMVRLSATPDGNAVVPQNFDRTYVLSFGPNKVVQAISAIPRFDVTEVGDYYIHAWVGEFTDPNSPDYVNLNLIQQGIAPISDILLQIQGSGICSSIDAEGATIVVDQIIPTLALHLPTIQVGDFLRVGNASASVDQRGQIMVSDQLGRVLVSKVLQLSEQPQTFEIEVLNAPKGIYFLSLIGAKDGVISSQALMLD